MAAAGQSKLINKVVSLKLFNDCDVRFGKRNKKIVPLSDGNKNKCVSGSSDRSFKKLFFHQIGSNFFSADVCFASFRFAVAM